MYRLTSRWIRALTTQTANLAQTTAQYGLTVLSHFDAKQHLSAELQEQYPWAQSIALVGQGAQGYWPVFSQSTEYLNGKPNPIDRWSQRIGDKIAQSFEGHALYPFTGPPYWPFLSWAAAAGDTTPSRLGMHLHRSYGLWHSYRFALLLPSPAPASVEEDKYQAPCDDCTKPCLTPCPVDAFGSSDSPSDYQVTKCRTYVRDNPDSICYTQGCQARLACPEGQGSHELAQHQYHMQVFAKG